LSDWSFVCKYSTRVSNELGAGKPQAAKLATRLVLCLALSEGLAISVIMILLREFWGYLYSNEEEVVTYIARMIPVLAISYFTDGIHTSLSGMSTGKYLARRWIPDIATGKSLEHGDMIIICTFQVC
jgi:Na+-driven multidrug efflux pump